MSKKHRWAEIIDLCQQYERIEVHTLVDQLGVSEATIRRDLQQMEDLRMISRYHGGAKLNNEQTVEPSMIYKHEANSLTKNKVARLASSLIKDNQMIYIDAGSSTFEMLQYISAKNITVVTSGIPHIGILGEKNIRTLVLGGMIRWSTQAITGTYALKQLEDMYFDIAFIGVNGIHKHLGYTTTNELEAAVKEKVINQSTTSYLLADASKFNKLYPIKYASLNQGVLISDSILDFNDTDVTYLLTDGTNNIS